MSPPTLDEKLLKLGRLRAQLRNLETELDLSDGFAEPITNDSVFPEEWAYRLVAQYATDLISIHAPNGDYLYASPNAKDFFGWSTEELIGKNAYELFHPEDLERIAADHAGHEDEQEGAVRYRMRQRDGSYLWVSTRSRARQAAKGVEQLVCLTRDIEAEILAERTREALLDQQRLRSLSELSATISHEINNPLAAATAELDYLRHAALNHEEDVSEAFESVENALSRISRTVRELQLLASVSQPRIEPVDCERVVGRILRLLWPKNHRVHVDLHPTRVHGDPGRIYQLAFELLTAHMSALAAGDELKISCRPRDDRGCVEIVGGSLTPSESLRIDKLEMMRQGKADGASPLELAKRLAAEQGGELELEQAVIGLRSRLILPAA